MKKSKELKKAKPNPKANRGILLFSYAVAALFLCLSAYFGYFLEVRSEDAINNPYNARIAGMENRMLRGKLLADDGTVLAQTAVLTDGTEIREYPYGDMFAHVVGYASPGKTGLEALANFYLLSSHANLLEKAANELSDKKNVGDSVVTTLNVRLQTIAYEALGDRRGAVVAMEPDTGKILAMVSKPAFDPNETAAKWEELSGGDSSEARLLNRATQGLYPPGSTFKIVTALEYMREHQGVYNAYGFDCSGIFAYENLKIQCYHKTAHGDQNFTEAFANSCNGAFAELGLTMDLKALKALSEQLLFNREQPLAIPYAKSIYRMEDDAGEWEIFQTVIGQGSTLMTPMHNLMLMAAVANGGILMEPYLIDHVENSGGQTVRRFTPRVYGELMVANESLALTELLTEVVNEGTGSAVKTEAYQAAGKTGSAEFENGKETHAWFVGFAPVEKPRIAVCVIVEEGGSAGSVAAPIARKLFDAYLGE